MGVVNSILITGSTGFLGSKILKKLVEEGFKVIALARVQSDLTRLDQISNEFEIYFINEKQNDFDDLFKSYKIDLIIHTATEYGRDTKTSNVFISNFIFPMKLIESGLEHGIKYFINSDTFFGKSAFKGSSYLNQYTISKEYFLNYLFSNRLGFKALNLRLEHVFGEFDSDTKFVSNLLSKLINSESEILLTEGSQKRDFVYVDDVVDAYLQVLVNIDCIENLTEFEVGNGYSIPVRNFVELMRELTNSKSQLFFGAISTKKDEIQDSKANIKPLLDIGWVPKYSLRNSIVKMINSQIK